MIASERSLFLSDANRYAMVEGLRPLVLKVFGEILKSFDNESML